MEETIVVSLKGEQWSPNTAPLKTAATAICRYDSCHWGSMDWQAAAAMGIARGKRIPIVPQEVPVENEITEPVMKIKDGMKTEVLDPDMREERY